MHVDVKIETKEIGHVVVKEGFHCVAWWFNSCIMLTSPRCFWSKCEGEWSSETSWMGGAGLISSSSFEWASCVFGVSSLGLSVIVL